MDRPSSNPLLGTPPSVSELSNRILSCEKDLAEIKRIVTEMNRKLDTLIAQLGASHVQDPSNNIVIGNAATPCVSWPPGGGASQQFQHDTIASGQNATYNDWGPDAGKAYKDLADPFSSMSGPDGGDAFRYGDPSNFEGFNFFVPPATFDDFGPHQPALDFATPRPASDDLHSLPPGMIPPLTAYLNDARAGPPPPLPIVQPIPLPPATTLGYETWGQGDHVDHDEGYKDCTGSGHHDRQLTHEGLNGEGDETQSETRQQSNTPAASSSGGGYDRQWNTEEKRRHFPLIFEALRIPWNGNELSSLPIIIESLGGTVPLVTIGSTQERAQKRTERRLYFEELKSLVGPWKNTQRVYELKVLERVLERVTTLNNNGAQTYEPYGAFRTQA